MPPTQPTTSISRLKRRRRVVRHVCHFPTEDWTSAKSPVRTKTTLGNRGGIERVGVQPPTVAYSNCWRTLP